MISFYILSERFFLKREGLSDGRVASITKKKNMILHYMFCKDSQYLKTLFHDLLDAIC